MIKRLKDYYFKKLGKFQLKKRILIFKKNRKLINSIAIVYYIPKSNPEKYNNWEDGFTKAIDLLAKEFKIVWFNLEDEYPKVEELNKYDLIIAKSCWNWIVDDYIKSLKGLTSLRGIAVSCSKAPKLKNDIWNYDIIWYEMEDYKKLIYDHPNIHQAFGINTNKFYPQNLEKKIDVLSIGMLEPYKRFDKLNNKKGEVKIIIGDKNSNNAEKVISSLDPNIEIINYTSQEKLAEYINMSKLVYIPASFQGGGERAVLEAKACGVEVEVEKDNTKLIKLLHSEKEYTIMEYYKALYFSIKSLL